MVGVEEGVQQLVVVCDDRSDVIGQQPVKAHVAKSQLGLAAAKLLLPVGSERDRRMATADGVLPAVQKLGPLLRKIAPRNPPVSWLVSALSTQRESIVRRIAEAHHGVALGVGDSTGRARSCGIGIRYPPPD